MQSLLRPRSFPYHSHLTKSSFAASKLLPRLNWHYIKRTKWTQTSPPNPEWKLGDGISQPEWNSTDELNWKMWDFEMGGVNSMERYKLLTSAIIPRPIAFVSSVSESGRENLAPFSYFSMVSHDPPLLSISFALSPRDPRKDTRENILATREFTVNIISEPFIEAANATSVDAPREVSEWELSGLRGIDSEIVKPKRVLESAVSFECSLYHAQDIYPLTTTADPPSSASSSPLTTQHPSTTFVLGLIKRAHIRSSVLTSDEKSVDPGKLQAMSRLGGWTYATVSEGFDIPRPFWEDRKKGGGMKFEWEELTRNKKDKIEE